MLMPPLSGCNEIGDTKKIKVTIKGANSKRAHQVWQTAQSFTQKITIQKDVVIGDNCKVQSHAFICELVTIGNDCFIGHGVMFVNDLFSMGGPARGNKDLWKSTKIGNNVSIGSNATILPVTICDKVVIGAGAVVTKNITEPGIYAGNPAKKIRNL